MEFSTKIQFDWLEYIALIIMLLISVSIGICFSIFKPPSTVEHYLMGNRNLKAFPVAMSMVASFISNNVLIGFPTDGYLYGMDYAYSSIGMILGMFISYWVYIPVMYQLKLTSSNEYLLQRFNATIQVIASLLYVLSLMGWLPVALYAVGLVVNQGGCAIIIQFLNFCIMAVSGIHIHIVIPIITSICIFYTYLGGLKTVVWADAIQVVFMYGSLILVAVKGTVDVGGLQVVLDRNLETGRIESPSLDFNPATKYTLWSITMGGGTHILYVTSCGQDILQRILSLPSMTSVKKTIVLFNSGVITIYCLAIYCGLVMYSTYYNCDPITSQKVSKKDQLTILYAMQLLAHYPGASGVFVAGLLSAALSSLSTGLNAMAVIVLKDFCPLVYKNALTEKQASRITKLTVLVFGAIYIGVIHLIESSATLVHMSWGVPMAIYGPLLGLYTMGMLLPWINSKGALAGLISSMTFMCWLYTKANIAISAGELQFPEKPVSTEGCTNKTFTASSNPDTMTEQNEFLLHHISYLYYTSVGCVIAIGVGLIVSFATGFTNPQNLKPELLSPVIRQLVRSRKNRSHIQQNPNGESDVLMKTS